MPASVIKQRFREQILHDVMHQLVPRAIESELNERGIEPVDTPNVKDVSLKEGEPLTFSASVETIPPFDPGDLSTVTAHRPVVAISDDAVTQSLQQLRERGAKFESVEQRPVAEGDTLEADLTRTDAKGETDRHDGVTIELGSPSNPPGFDANLIGLEAGQSKQFSVQFPPEYPVPELAGQELAYEVTVKAIRRKSLPELDDAFAKDLGDFENFARHLDDLGEHEVAEVVAVAHVEHGVHQRAPAAFGVELLPFAFLCAVLRGAGGAAVQRRLAAAEALVGLGEEGHGLAFGGHAAQLSIFAGAAIIVDAASGVGTVTSSISRFAK